MKKPDPLNKVLTAILILLVYGFIPNKAGIELNLNINQNMTIFAMK